jgi:hypothetical protein
LTSFGGQSLYLREVNTIAKNNSCKQHIMTEPNIRSKKMSFKISNIIFASYKMLIFLSEEQHKVLTAALLAFSW